MCDVVVTVPMNFKYAGKKGLAAWIAEGDAAGDEWSGEDSWCFSTYGVKPDIKPSERVYVVCEGRLRGYAPLIKMEHYPRRGKVGVVYLMRGGGAVAVTIPDKVTGFRGWRKRWWLREDEVPFLDWRTP